MEELRTPSISSILPPYEPQVSPDAPVIVSEQGGVCADSLAKLCAGDIDALVVRGYSDPTVCERLASWAAGSGAAQPYLHEEYEGAEMKTTYYGVDRIGIPFNATLGGTEARRREYYASARPNTRAMRQACGELLSPIDKLRLELDDRWDQGAQVARLQGRRLFVGVVRLMHHRGSRASERNPHFDALPESIYEFERQIAANIYVRMPDRGGELLLWPSPELRAGESIGNPSGRPVRLRPQVGDLVLFNSRKAHGTASFDRGTRISVQCFIGYAPNSPLLLWN